MARRLVEAGVDVVATEFDGPLCGRVANWDDHAVNHHVFQAIKHRMADLYVAVQSARAVVAEAVADPSPTSAALARLAASEAFSAVAAEAVQMHGGIAITWESDIQLYFKRAHGSAQLLGPPRQQLRRLESEVF